MGIGCISRTILGYEEGLISRGLDIRTVVYRVVIGVYYLDKRLVAWLGIEFGGMCTPPGRLPRRSLRELLAMTTDTRRSCSR